MTVAAPSIFDTTHLISSFGLAGLLIIIFAECGLLIGFFLPGDTLLFAAGLLYGLGRFPVPFWSILIGVPVAATLGSLTGYWIGRKAGPPIFDRPDSRFFKRAYLERAHAFFESRGPFAIIAGRFIPIVRTFITVVAGAGAMNFARYALYSALVSAVWGAGLPLAGYYLGNVTLIKNNVEVFTLLIAVVSIMPVIVEFIRHRRRRVTQS